MRISSVGAILLLVASPILPTARAATFSAVHRSEYHYGVVYGTNLSGYVLTLAQGETVTDVRIFYGNIHGYAGQAQGTYNPNTGAWATGIGSFDMYDYYAQITTTINGRKHYYTTQLYYWGH